MPAQQYFNGLGPQSDPMPSAVEQIAMRQRPQSLQASSNQTSSDDHLGRRTPKPEIPKKNKHLEEIYRLTQKLSELQSENDQVHDSIGQIALDLDEVEQNLAMKTRELEGTEAALATARKDMQAARARFDQEKQDRIAIETKLGDKDTELAIVRQQAQVLSTQLDQEKQSRTKVEDALRRQETVKEEQSSGMQQKIESLLATMEQKGVQDSGDVARLQAEVFRLTSIVANKDEELKKSESVAVESERRLTGHLQDQSSQIEELKRAAVMAAGSDQNWANQLHDQNQRLEEQIKLREVAETALLAQQEQASVGVDMAELRRLCDFYQANSQRLSKQIKQEVVFVPATPPKVPK